MECFPEIYFLTFQKYLKILGWETEEWEGEGERGWGLGVGMDGVGLKLVQDSSRCFSYFRILSARARQEMEHVTQRIQTKLQNLT